MIAIKFREDTRVKPHIVMRSLRNVVVLDIAGRTAIANPVEFEETCSTFKYDPGGMFWQEVYEYKFRFRDGFTVGVNAQHFDLFCSSIESAQTRTQKGKTYYKIHGKHWCLCLTPERMDVLRAWAAETEEEAEAVFDGFLRKKKESRCARTT